MTGKSTSPPPQTAVEKSPGKNADREAQLAQALRDNLRRRKVQAQARATTANPAPRDSNSD